MKRLNFHMRIVEPLDRGYRIHIRGDNGDEEEVRYEPERDRLDFRGDTDEYTALKRNRAQLQRILSAKRPETFYVGFSLDFIISDGDEEAHNGFMAPVRIDRRPSPSDEASAAATGEPCPLIISDGSLDANRQRGAYAVLIVRTDRRISVLSECLDAKSSNHMELLGVLRGIELCGDAERLTVVTDSRYVIRGMKYWLENWKRNGWHTANGESPRHLESWKRCDRLLEGKCVDLKWLGTDPSPFVRWAHGLCDALSRDLVNEGDRG